MTTKQVCRQEIDGISTRVACAGEGLAVVFLHGWGASYETFWPAAERLARQGFTVHVLDLPGFGGTGLPPEPWGVPQYTQWVLAYLDANQLDEIFLVGHSFGGRISLVLGADHPNRVRKIVLSNSAGVKLPPPLKIRFYYIWRRALLTVLSLPGLGSMKQRVLAYLRQRYGSSDYLQAGPLTETFKLVIAQDLLPFARRVQAPTLLFWGDQDTDTPLAAGKILEREMPDAGLIVFEGAGHYAYLDDLAQFVRVVSYFFSEEVEAAET
jgi:pimeloyl-ACP methyl ester carboxylesterase